MLSSFQGDSHAPPWATQLGGLCRPVRPRPRPWLPLPLASPLGPPLSGFPAGVMGRLGQAPCVQASSPASCLQGTGITFRDVLSSVGGQSLLTTLAGMFVCKSGRLGVGKGSGNAQRLVFPKSAQRSTRAAHRGSLWGARASGQGTEMARPARRAGGRLPRKGLQKRVPSSDSRLEAPGQRSPLPQKWVRGANKAGLRLKSRLLLRVKCKSELRSRKTRGASSPEARSCPSVEEGTVCGRGSETVTRATSCVVWGP